MGLLDKWSQLKNKKKTAGVAKDLSVFDKNSDKPEKEKKEESKMESAVKNYQTKGDGYRLLLRPLISEKSAIGESMNVYNFVVQKDATKIDISNAINELYGIKPVSVRMTNIQGKTARFGRRIGRRGDWKKAMVTLPKGKSLQLHAGV